MPNITNYLEKLNNVSNIANTAHYAYSNGTLSFSLVYSKNGKRITFSKQLAQRLGLSDAACIGLLPDEGVILVAQKLPEEKHLQVSLKGDDKKISYNAGVTERLVKAFNLDYSKCSSKAFSNITFEKDGDMEIAVIKLSSPISTSKVTDKGVTENENS